MNSEKNERYLFRGKRIDNGEWISGYLWKNNKKPYISNDAVELMVVDSATVGQCTGLRDKNGTLIFEGDLVKFPESYMGNRYIIEFGYYPGEYESDAPNYGWYLEEIGTAHKSSAYSCEDERVVCGNIHDNPELIRRT